MTLLANSDEWQSRSLETILGPHGYSVLRAYTGKQTIERAVSARPDLIILDADLPDLDGFEVCRQLRDHPAISASTPIIMTSSGHSSRQRRIDALKAGAWDFIGGTFDGEELPLRLDALVRGKQEADRVRDESLLDELTGLYNVRGLARRAHELGAQAYRRREPMACLVLTPVFGSDQAEGAHSMASDADLTGVAQMLRRTGRASDVIGTMGPGEFAIIAQGTNHEGAARFAERLAEVARESFGSDAVRIAVGYDAVANYHEAPVEPSDLLTRANAAMHQSRRASRQQRGSVVRRYDATLH